MDDNKFPIGIIILIVVVILGIAAFLFAKFINDPKVNAKSDVESAQQMYNVIYAAIKNKKINHLNAETELIDNYDNVWRLVKDYDNVNELPKVKALDDGKWILKNNNFASGDFEIWVRGSYKKNNVEEKLYPLPGNFTNEPYSLVSN